ncbi:xenotropic and polytropic retrovirus receptor 1 [Diplogelasinospora grovesii]|uniref:Xenotropic and polytropic retrovirus receptor 1 n=1 Tax=Diplogelasinospora grovesii TaxID=303347 RepID=A0AAN6S2T2_9PEZI|nr:xenotropic and polytropic retrovirus receptor 1 [Diplogelasinospora grovesii]
MKYGEQFEKESVPQWSLHNLDYNSLKHYIKVHTTRDQATAIAIPGHQDTALGRFEDELYAELCRQHDRLDLFVTSKADEISRRLQHLSNQIHRLIIRSATSSRDRIPLKRQRRFAKYEQDLLRCGDDIQALQRFVNAQVVAFRKILKKYRKWTGSSTLGTRFRDSVLSHPKSFTKRDFSQLQSTYEDLLTTLRQATLADVSGVASPNGEPTTPARRSSASPLSPSETLAAPASQQPSGYWNEYDYGSEAGDMDRNEETSYAIYVNPDEDSNFFPGVTTLAAVFTAPVKKMKAWISRRRGGAAAAGGESGPLLPTHSNNSYGSTTAAPGYFTSPPGGSLTDTEVEDDGNPLHMPGPGRRSSYGGYASSTDEFPAGGYEARYASLPSINEQRIVARYREQVLFWGAWCSFAVSYILMGIAAILIATGRHRLRLEVDAGVTLGIVTSLGSACAGLGMTLARPDRIGWLHKAAVYAAFAVACVINGMLLVFVVGNAP